MTSFRPALRPRPLAELAEAIGATLHPGSDGLGGADLISGVSLDSRAIVAGDLYAALPGATVHGAQFAQMAIAAGARAVLTDSAGLEIIEKQASRSVPVITRADPRAVLGAAASVLYGTGADLGVRLIGITGTNGKTTTAYLVANALERLGRTIGMIGTIETRVGTERVTSKRTTPEMTDLHALLGYMDERGVDDCVMEVSSHALAQHRVDGVRYDVAIFTNLSQDHLDFHASMEEYFRAKAMLFTPERAAHGVIVVDDEWGQRLAEASPIPVVTLSADPERPADVHVSFSGENELIIEGALPEAVGSWSGILPLTCTLIGDFNRVNTATAALTLLALGHEAPQIAQALSQPPIIPGRMQPVTRPGGGGDPRCLVDFAHTPDAIASALQALRRSTPGSLIAVLGAGGSRDPGKRPAMGYAAAMGADVVIVTDDNPRTEDPAAIRAAVLAGGAQAHEEGCTSRIEEIADRARAITTAVNIARSTPGSTVAVLGKGHEQGQEVGGRITPFDDGAEVIRALEGRAPENRPGASATASETTS